MNFKNSIKQKVVKIEKLIKEQQPAPYDFHEYTDINDMIGYVGYITPQGTFYRVRDISKANGSHGEWAFGYLYNLGYKPSMVDYNANILELLNNPDFNFTMLIESPTTKPPIYFCPGIHMTEKQREVINALTNGLVNDADLSRFEAQPDNEELYSHTNRKY